MGTVSTWAVLAFPIVVGVPRYIFCIYHILVLLRKEGNRRESKWGVCHADNRYSSMLVHSPSKVVTVTVTMIWSSVADTYLIVDVTVHGSLDRLVTLVVKAELKWSGVGGLRGTAAYWPRISAPMSR